MDIDRNGLYDPTNDMEKEANELDKKITKEIEKKKMIKKIQTTAAILIFVFLGILVVATAEFVFCTQLQIACPLRPYLGF